MKWFSNLRIAKKLGVSFCLILALMTGLGVFSIVRLAGVNERATELGTEWLVGVDTIGSLRSHLAMSRTKELRHVMTDTAEGKQQFAGEFVTLMAMVDKRFKEYEPTITLEADRKLFDELAGTLTKYKEINSKLFALSAANKKQEAVAELNAGQATYDAALNKATEMVEYNRKESQRVAAETTTAYESARTMIISCLIGSIMLGMGLAYGVARIISRPVSRMSEVAGKLAEGDVNQTIDIDSRDEVGQLADAFREMISAQKELAAAAATITAGNMNVDVKIRGDKDVLGQSFNQLKQTIGNLVTETNSVVQAAQQGQLDKRGDANKFRGAYQELLQGFNSTLDAVIEPVMEAANVLEQVAERDMTKRVQGAYRGDHAKIKNALNQALDNLEEALSQAASGAGQVTSAANEISRGSQSLAQGASEQASSLEEVSSSLEEMSSMTKQNADNSNQGKLLAAEARVSSERGNEAMQRMGDAISKIKSSADATAKILRTIDEIAFQTNLLALNAAVEAARAGEAGKGFAVVAEEVRNLAQRSAEAAKNTANLIEESVTNADGGVRIAEEVAKLLSEIGEGSRKVNDLVGEIAAACNEQSKGIDQINVAVTQLDKVTQQNAASSEESASAAEELNSQAISLSQIVAQFRLNGVKQAATPAAANTRRTSGATQERSKRTRDNVPDERELVGAGSTRGKNNASRILPLDDDDFSGF